MMDIWLGSQGRPNYPNAGQRAAIIYSLQWR